MNNIDQILANFNSEADKAMELEKNINLFAEEIAEKLLYQLDQDGVIGEFEETVFSFKFISKHNLFNKAIYDVKLLDLTDYRKCLRFSVPEQAKNIKVATFEHEGRMYTLQQELKSALTLLLFDYYGLQFGINEEDDGSVRI